MSKVVALHSTELFAFIKSIFAIGNSARITVTGNSMFPFLRDCIDSVELVSDTFHNIRKGDIVLAEQSNGDFLLHRVYKINQDYFYLLGDGQVTIEGPFNPNQLVAKVLTVWRREQRIDCRSITWRFLSHGWLCTLPLRCLKIAAKNLIKSIVKADG